MRVGPLSKTAALFIFSDTMTGRTKGFCLDAVPRVG
jgi:hypothetical protein